MSTTAPPWRNPIEATRRVVDHAKQLGRLELELKTIIVKRKATDFGIGAGFGLVALMLSPLIVMFAAGTIAAALATTMSVWLAILIVTFMLLLLVAGLAGAAYLFTKKAAANGFDDAT